MVRDLFWMSVFLVIAAVVTVNAVSHQSMWRAATMAPMAQPPVSASVEQAPQPETERADAEIDTGKPMTLAQLPR